METTLLRFSLPLTPCSSHSMIAHWTFRLPTDDDDENMHATMMNEQSETFAYGTAFAAFGGHSKGIEACNGIAALIGVLSINSLLSYYIHPLQAMFVRAGIAMCNGEVLGIYVSAMTLTYNFG
ncbi:hypothetical protein LguiA_002855 [Lonicera macranthoides]